MCRWPISRWTSWILKPRIACVPNVWRRSCSRSTGRPARLLAFQEPAVEPRATDRLAGLGVVLEDQHLTALAVTERRERLSDVSCHGDRPYPAPLVAGVTAGGRETVLEAQDAGVEVDVSDLQPADPAQARTGLGSERVDGLIHLRVRLGDQLAHLLGRVELKLALALYLLGLPRPGERRARRMRAEDAAHDAAVVVDRVGAAFGLRQLVTDGEQVIRTEGVKDAVGPGRVAPPWTLGQALPDLPVSVHRGAAQTLLHGAVAHERVQSYAERATGARGVRRVLCGEGLCLHQRVAFGQISVGGAALPRPCGTEHLAGVLPGRKDVAHDPDRLTARFALARRGEFDLDQRVRFLGLHRDLFS